jgi:methylmalonyl-CoA mutase cobalamin-binding subunit
VVRLVDQLPEYRIAIRAKVDRLRGEPGGTVERASRAVRDLGADLGLAPPTGPETGAADAPAGTATPVAPVTGPQARAPTARETLDSIRAMVAPLLAPLATLGAVVVFTVVILLQRADLRDRLYRLAGANRIAATATALDEAAGRVSRYLRMQVVVNVSYGLPIGMALWWLGIPNALLWGILAAVLRFVPYVGPWIAAAFPLLLALAIGEDWSLLLWTAGVFLALELVGNNVIEPWLYGASTGLSPVAILVSALFWTWLWGLPGLLLAVPLTVCVAVIGRHIPQLAFLDVILGDAPVLAPHERLYQRLLAADEHEAGEIADAHLEADGRERLYADVLLPALALAEADRHRGRLDAERARGVLDATRRIVEATAPDADAAASAAARPVVLVVAAHDEADALAAAMLAALLAGRGIAAETIGEDVLAAEAAESARAREAHAICVSALPPMATVHVAYLCKRLRRACPDAQLVAGLWTDVDGLARVGDRLRAAGADRVVSTLDDAVEALRERTLRAGAPVHASPADRPPAAASAGARAGPGTRRASG